MFADEIPEAIQWHEGMLLTPQHFQVGGQRQEMLAQYHALLLAPFGWGVRRFLPDGKLLPTGTLRILELEAVMPDGTVVVHRAESDELIVDLAAYASATQEREAFVHLTLPARKGDGVRGSLPRYASVDGPPMIDENTGEGDVRIPRLRPRLSLVAGETPPPKFTSLPLAKVQFEGESWTLADYVPPTTTVDLRSRVGSLCSELVARLREKAMYLSERVRAPSSVLDKPMLMEERTRIACIVGGLPHFEAVLSTGIAHPFALYLSLCGLAGQLASLGPGMLPPVFPPYDHKDILASFTEVARFATRMIEEGVPESYQAIPFKFKDGVFSLQFETAWANKRLVIGARISPKVTEKDLTAWVDECLIGSDSVIPSLRERRILGAGRHYVERDEDLVPVRGVVLYALDYDVEFIKTGQSLQVFDVGPRSKAFRPLELVLYVKERG